MVPEIEDRVTVKVENIRKQPKDTLPHICAQQKIRALMKGSNLGANRLTKQPSPTHTLQGLHSTGSWGLQRKEKCLPLEEGGATCLICGTAPLVQASTQDVKLLKAAKEKPLKKTLLKRNKRIKRRRKRPNFMKMLAQEDVSILSSAALSSFKMSNKRRYALSARSGLADKHPPPQDTNIWNTTPCQAQWVCLLRQDPGQDCWPLQEKGSVNHTGPDNLYDHQKGLWALFAAE